MELWDRILISQIALLHLPAVLVPDILCLLSRWDGSEATQLGCWEEMPLLAGGNIPEIRWARISLFFSLFFSLKLVVDSCAETFSGWKQRWCKPRSETVVISRYFCPALWLCQKAMWGMKLLCALSWLTTPVRPLYLNLYCQGFSAGSLAHAGDPEACDLILVTFSCQL